MTESTNEKRMAQNESTFRTHNQRLQRSIDEMNAIGAEDNIAVPYIDGDTQFHFVCECANEDCKDRIMLSLDQYTKAHEDKDTFTVIPGHVVPKIEDLVFKSASYCVVRKHEIPPEGSTKLFKTVPITDAS